MLRFPLGTLVLVLILLVAAPLVADEAADSMLAAVRAGDVAGVQALIASGTSPDIANDYGFSGLLVAAVTGQEEIVETLIAAGADVALTSSTRPRRLDTRALPGA